MIVLHIDSSRRGVDSVSRDLIGICDVQFIQVEGLDVGPESRANALAHAKRAIDQVLDGCIEQAA